MLPYAVLEMSMINLQFIQYTVYNLQTINRVPKQDVLPYTTFYITIQHNS